MTCRCSPSWKWTHCSRNCKLAPTDLNTFGEQQTKKQGDGNFPLTHNNVRHFTGRMWNKWAEVGMKQKRLIHPSPRSTNYTLTGQMYCTAVTVGAHFGENAPVSLARSPFFRHLSFSVASQLWIGQLCWNMSLESRLLILFYFKWMDPDKRKPIRGNREGNNCYIEREKEEDSFSLFTHICFAMHNFHW